MSARRLPTWRLVALSWNDVWRAVRAMPLLFCCAILILLATRIGETLLPGRRWSGPVFGPLADVLENTVQYFCLTPVMIAIHRFIIRGDVTRSYVANPAEPDFLLFFTWTMAISILYSLVFAVNEALMTHMNAAARSSFAAFIMFVITLIVATWLSVRLIVLFPAIAVGASGAKAANAFADTKGYDVTLLAIFLLAFIPMIILSVLVTFTLTHTIGPHHPAQSFVGDISFAVFGTVTEALGVAIASHIYLAIGRRVRG